VFPGGRFSNFLLASRLIAAYSWRHTILLFRLAVLSLTAQAKLPLDQKTENVSL
jgi:hypothetical protein